MTTTFSKPYRMNWQDPKIIKEIILLKQNKVRNKAIAKEYGVSEGAVEVILAKLRKSKKWSGKIPYCKLNVVEDVLKPTERVGILDIEFFAMKNRWGNFDARTGFILCYVIEDFKGNKKHTGVINPDDLNKGLYDKHLIKKLVKDLKRYDVVYGYFHIGCDLPYIRTRAMNWNIDFPTYDTIRLKDLYPIIKNKFTLISNSLKEACLLFGIKGKTTLNFQNWFDAVICRGKKQKDSLKIILDHCIADVHSCTKPLAKKILKFGTRNTTPL